MVHATVGIRPPAANLSGAKRHGSPGPPEGSVCSQEVDLWSRFRRVPAVSRASVPRHISRGVSRPARRESRDVPRRASRSAFRRTVRALCPVERPVCWPAFGTVSAGRPRRIPLRVSRGFRRAFRGVSRRASRSAFRRTVRALCPVERPGPDAGVRSRPYPPSVRAVSHCGPRGASVEHSARGIREAFCSVSRRARPGIRPAGFPPPRFHRSPARSRLEGGRRRHGGEQAVWPWRCGPGRGSHP